MKYWDNDKDRLIDEAIDELNREERYLLSKENEYNIDKPMKLYGAI